MKFSIITCTYNSAAYLQKNIDSVKNQTLGDFEHIFIDGFSADRTVEIINKYQQEFPDKVKLFQFEPKGISNAMNKGIEKSSGAYLIHLHSDDNFFSEDILEKTNAFLKDHDNLDWIYGKINVVEENNNSVGIFPKKIVFQLGDMFFSRYLLKFFNFIPHQAVFIKKEVFGKFGGFDETIKSMMDFDLWLRLRDKTSWIFFDQIVCNYKIHPNAQSSGKMNQKENLLNLAIVQRRYLNLFEFKFAKIINTIVNSMNHTIR